MTIKILFGTAAAVISIVSIFPYLRDILSRKTTPHMYSWLVWAILQATATAAILRDNSLWSAAGVATAGLVSGTVFLFSLKYGTKNVTQFDTLCLIGALAAIGIWLFVNDVTLSIILVTAIDFLGFLPTYRKGYEEPYSETLFLYVCSTLSNLFVLLSITQYSFTSSLYVASLFLSNAIFVSILVLRRRAMSKR